MTAISSTREFKCHLSSTLTPAQVSGKKTAPLSNEARRELAKQARALKEERRAALDGRHKYLMGRLAEAVALAEAEAEDAIIADEKVASQTVGAL